MSTGDEIIKLEEGYSKVRSEGIEPFLRYIEENNREFFKAKEFVKLYDLIFKMCIQRDPYNWSGDMYERYCKSIRDYLKEKVAPNLMQIQKSNFETDFLKEWDKRWNNQRLIVKGLSKLFMYLDRFYTPNTDDVLPLVDQGYKLYKDIIFDPFAEYARKCILNSIQRERDAEQQDRHLLSQAVQVFVEMGIYRDWETDRKSTRLNSSHSRASRMPSSA